jgi:hypothetical protein
MGVGAAGRTEWQPLTNIGRVSTLSNIEDINGLATKSLSCDRSGLSEIEVAQGATKSLSVSNIVKALSYIYYFPLLHEVAQKTPRPPLAQKPPGNGGRARRSIHHQRRFDRRPVNSPND